MTCFKDAVGNEWQVELDVEAIRRVRKETGFAFGTCLNDGMSTLYEMLEDYELLPAVLAAIIKPSLDSKGVAESTFVNNIKGEAIEAAQTAIWEALSFFCPPKQRRMMEAIREASDKMSDEQMALAIQQMETFTEKQSKLEPSSELIPDLIATEN